MKSLMIYTSRTVLMQRLADGLSHGYTYWTSGTVAVNRSQKLVKKFELTYQILADRNLRARRKRAGLGNARILLWQNGDTIRWWLLVTPPNKGEHAAHSLEKLRIALEKDGRIEVDGFELVQLPKSGTSNTKWTWRMGETKYQNWRNTIIDTVRKGSQNSLHQMLYQLWSTPGFAGNRSQVGKLVALYKAEVKRASRKDAPIPPKRLHYVRRLRNGGASLAQLTIGSAEHCDGYAG